MVAAVVSTSHVPAGSVTTVSFPGVVASGGNAVVVLLNIRDGAGANYVSATWNGAPVTAADTQLDTVTDGMQLHAIAFTGLSGTQTLAITLDAAADDVEGWANVISAANTSDVLGTAVWTASGNFESPSSGTVSADANAIVLSQVRARADLTASMDDQAGQTTLDGPQTTANTNTIMLSSKAGAASVSSGFTFDDSGLTFTRVQVVPINGTGGGGRSVSSISDATLTHGQTGISVDVTGYAATGKTVKICPTDDVNDAGGVAQTVTAQDASSVTFTAVLNSFSFGATLYVFVLEGGDPDEANADGEAVARIVASATLNFTGADFFFDEDGDPVEMTGTLYVWRSPRPPSSGGTPDQIITSFTTSSAGERSQSINLGSLDDGDTVFATLFGADGTDIFWAGEALPDYA